MRAMKPTKTIVKTVVLSLLLFFIGITPHHFLGDWSWEIVKNEMKVVVSKVVNVPKK